MGKVEDFLNKSSEIMKKSLAGLDYDKFETKNISFDYKALMDSVPYDINDVLKIQKEYKVGKTPIYELKNINKIVKKLSKPGYGAKILLKDEANNASGSFKARRASLSLFHAKKLGYEGVVAETSGNYGAAVASQAAQMNLKAIIVQEVFDSKWIGQPEILEKSRACEAYGAEVWQMTVGPELFYWTLVILNETGYFNASLYTPFAIKGIETLGYEIALDVYEKYGKYPDFVLATHAGGGNITGTKRGLLLGGAKETKVIGVSVDLRGLHMASDRDFNRKSFTTGHTGFGVPFLVKPDRTDVPRNAARALRYIDNYFIVSQGEVFYSTILLAQIEGLERGPAGNTALAAAIPFATKLPEDKMIVVQETEYTGAGKHPYAQLTFAKKMGVEVVLGNPKDNIPGKRIVIPEDVSWLRYEEMNLNELKLSYLKHSAQDINEITKNDLIFLKEEVNEVNSDFVERFLYEKGVKING
ncbi:MAG: 2-amino-4-oxopentanoate thiolase subunit OrtB [Caldisericia bacterium]